MARPSIGPWSYDNAGKIMDADGMPVATVERAAGGSDEQTAANGTLLAAAPMLLAGVHLALGWLNLKEELSAEEARQARMLQALGALAVPKPGEDPSLGVAEGIALQAAQLAEIRDYESDSFSVTEAEVTPIEAQHILNCLQARLLAVLCEGGALTVDGSVLAELLDQVRAEHGSGPSELEPQGASVPAFSAMDWSRFGCVETTSTGVRTMEKKRHSGRG